MRKGREEERSSQLRRTRRERKAQPFINVGAKSQHVVEGYGTVGCCLAACPLPEFQNWACPHGRPRAPGTSGVSLLTFQICPPLVPPSLPFLPPELQKSFPSPPPRLRVCLASLSLVPPLGLVFPVRALRLHHAASGERRPLLVPAPQNLLLCVLSSGSSSLSPLLLVPAPEAFLKLLPTALKCTHSHAQPWRGSPLCRVDVRVPSPVFMVPDPSLV